MNLAVPVSSAEARLSSVVVMVRVVSPLWLEEDWSTGPHWSLMLAADPTCANTVDVICDPYEYDFENP